MGHVDRLGRATFHHIAPQGDVRPTARALVWMRHIARHGPQSSVLLHALTRSTHRCKDTALRELQRLRAGGLFFLPPQQRATERAEFNPYVYDLSARGRAWLHDEGDVLPPRLLSGPWAHQHLTASLTGAIDIAARGAGLGYIPGQEILARMGASLGIPLGDRLVIPDQLFALDHGGRYRAFLVEVDRGTEPGRSDRARKSVTAMLGAYGRLLAEDGIRRHYGLRCPVGLLLVTDRPGRIDLFRSIACTMGSSLTDHLLLRSLDDRPDRPDRQDPQDCLRGWERPDGSSFDLGAVGPLS